MGLLNFTDTVFNTSATGNVIKYNLQHADSTTEQVQLSVATPITTQGTAMNKAFFDKIEKYLVPVGTICMWSGAVNTIPTGWAICNGSNGTPDLRDRFIVGAGSTYSVGATGGEATHTLTVEEIPSHRHSISAKTYNTARGTGGSVNLVDPTSNYTGYTGGGQAHENRPPYYALAYIMKLSN